MDFTIPEEMKMLQALVRRFVATELLPLEREVEEKDDLSEDVRRALKRKARGLGLWGIFMPREYGGGGLGALAMVIVCEELGGVSVALGYQGGIVGGPRAGWWTGDEMRFATGEQKEKYFLPIVRGEKERFGAMTEPEAGSDLANMQTRAEERGDSYVLNGTKVFVTGVDSADFGLVFAVTDPRGERHRRITAFIVDKSAPGFFVTRRMETIGRRGLHEYELHLSDCAVPAKNILGEVGQGLDLATSGLVSTRLACSSAVLGMAQRALNMAKEYSRRRVTFGQVLAQRQAIQAMIIDSEIEVLASRLMLYNLAWDHDRGVDVATRIMLVKPFVTEMACRVIDRAIQIHGGYGYTKELPLDMMYRDARLYRIADGASEVLRWTAARRLLRG